MSEATLKTIHPVHFNDFKKYETAQVRENFLLSNLEKDDTIELVYTHYDRMIAGLANPIHHSLELPTYVNLKSDYFLERREIGIFNVGNDGTVEADGIKYELSNQDCLYIGKGTKKVVFSSIDADKPAKFFLCSAPAHQTFPTVLCKVANANHLQLGSTATANERELNQYIYDGGVQSCQLVMGITSIKPGSVWNSVPPHTHDRRSEIYFYFNLTPENILLHVMGKPQETRHLILKNHEAIVSPPWSVHFGTGTSNYSFIWAMAGENKQFTDMDPAPVTTLL